MKNQSPTLGRLPYVLQKPKVSSGTNVWVSHPQKQLFFTERESFEPIQFATATQLMAYVRRCVKAGYLVG